MSGWETRQFMECVSTPNAPAKIKRKEYKDAGSYPIVSQEADFINGYWDDENDVIVVDRPIVIFGDHTQVVKYVDFDFVVGADGVKLLAPKPFLEPRFLYYFLLAHPVKTLGYARHYRLIKLLEVRYPSLPDQKRIVAILDEAFVAIDDATANAEKNLANAREVFESYLAEVFKRRSNGWKKRRIPDVCSTFGRGKSRHRPRNEPSLYGGLYPFVQTGDISTADHVITAYRQTYSDKGLAQSKMWPKGTVGIAIVGATIGESAVLGFDACFPDSVIGMTVDPTKADPYFIEYLLQHFKDEVKSRGKGSARHNINLGTFDELDFPIPLVSEQRKVAENADALRGEVQQLDSIYTRKLALLAELKQSILQKAFSGELTAAASVGAAGEMVEA